MDTKERFEIRPTRQQLVQALAALILEALRRNKLRSPVTDQKEPRDAGRGEQDPIQEEVN